MNRRRIFCLSVIPALALLLLPGSAAAQKLLKEQLVGTWTITSWEQVRPNSDKFQRFGVNPKGVHTFDGNGRYVVMFARSDLPKFAVGDPMKATPQEVKTVMDGTIAYYGTYSVDEATKVVSLTVEASTFPNQVGAENKRTITLISANELKYQNTNPTSGGQINIAFKRAPVLASK
jgi:hypothetical protein